MNNVELAAFVIMRSVFVAGGAMCVFLAYRLIVAQRTGAERLEKAITDLKWKIADARRAITEATHAQDRFSQAERSAFERLYDRLELPPVQAKLEAARASAEEQHIRMRNSLKDIQDGIERVHAFHSNQQHLDAGKSSQKRVHNTAAWVLAGVLSVIAMGLFFVAARGWSHLPDRQAAHNSLPTKSYLTPSP